jgi:hypothetical protein
MNWNMGDPKLRPFKTKRTKVNYELKIDVPIEEAFSFLNDRLGTIKENTLWCETKVGEILFKIPAMKMHWFVTLYDEEEHKFDAAILSTEPLYGKLESQMIQQDGDSTLVKMALIFTAFNDDGSKYFGNELENRMLQILKQLGTSLKNKHEKPLIIKERLINTSFIPLEMRSSNREIIKGSANDFFHLLGPYEELKWIDGWKFHMVYSESGVNEDDCVFIENLSSFAVLEETSRITYWNTTIWDGENHRFHAALLSPDFTIANYRVKVDRIDDEFSLWTWNFDMLGLNEKGNKNLQEKGRQEKVDMMIKLLGTQLKYYIENQELLKTPTQEKIKILSSLIKTKIRRAHAH